ncbi:MAG: YdcF family protein [Spirochaetes bacterium]|nr:YdcF family protein [Spirochaetota bacterium]
MMKILRKKFLLPFIVLGVLLFTLCLIFNSIMLHTAKPLMKNEISEIKKAQAVLLLGAGVYKGNRVSYVLYDRINAAVELYKSGKASKILVSGDHGSKEYDEVNTIKIRLIQSGIPERDIFTDHAGFSTYDSVLRAKKIFLVESMIIVTQEYHLTRALYLSTRCSIQVQGYSSDKRKYKMITYYMMRERLARFKDFIKINIIKADPKFLGEEIPITGDGRDTRG